MKTNGNIKKYFDALNKRLDGEFGAIGQRFGRIEGRLGALEQLVETMRQHQEKLSRIVAELVKVVEALDERVTNLEKRVERLETGQTVLIKMVTEIRGLESGKKLELKDVRYDDASHSLSGTVREKGKRYGRRRK